jgi:hypothetical protein
MYMKLYDSVLRFMWLIIFVLAAIIWDLKINNGNLIYNPSITFITSTIDRIQEKDKKIDKLEQEIEMLKKDLTKAKNTPFYQ